MRDIIIKDGKYICPKCGSRRILIDEECVVYKTLDANSGKILNPRTLKSQMSNREKAEEYNKAETDGIGQWQYKCRECGWKSEV